MMLCRWWRGRELRQRFERSTKGCREKEKRGDCSKELTLRFSQSQLHRIHLSTSLLVLYFLCGPLLLCRYYWIHCVTQLKFDCGFPHSFHYVPHPFPSFLINSVKLFPSLPHYLGHHQRGCRCNRPVWPLWWGLWRNARRRISSYWNQQDAHFPVYRGKTKHTLT